MLRRCIAVRKNERFKQWEHIETKINARLVFSRDKTIAKSAYGGKGKFPFICQTKDHTKLMNIMQNICSTSNSNLN